MAKTRKTPQQKKQDVYTKDHFTFGYFSSRKLSKTWKRKKTHVNRQYRRKSQNLLTKAKPSIAVNNTELIADNLTATHFEHSISRKRLKKTGTVSIAEKVKMKLNRRKE